MANNNISILIYTVSGTTPVVALTGNFDLRVSPYSSTGIAGVHQGGGTWNFAGLSDIADYKLYNTDTNTVMDSLNGGGTTVFFDGDLQLYLKKAGGTMSGAIAMGGNKITGLSAGSATGDAMRYDETVDKATAQTISAVKTFSADAIPLTTSGRVYTGSLRQIPDVQYLQDTYGLGGSGTPFGIATKRLLVDSQATAVAGKIYTTIQGAITYAVTQTPSASSRWTIIIVPHHSTGYAEDITMARFVDLLGWGCTYIVGGLTTTHVTTAQTWTGRDARMENLVFNGTDKAMYVRLLHTRDCILKANGAGGEVPFYIDGSEMINTGIYTQNDVDLQANNTEQENRSINCYGNETPVWETTDIVYSFDEVTGDQYEF